MIKLIIVKKDEIINKMARAGFTGAGLAKASGVSQSYIVQILSGNRNMLPPTAKKICTTLQCEFDDIFILKTGESNDE